MSDIKINETELRNEILHYLLINNADHQLNDLNSIMNFATRHNILQYPHKTASKHYDKKEARSKSNDQNDTQKYRQKRQTTREPIDPGDDAVMYIPISTTSSCPAGSNSVADASVNGISQMVFLWTIMSVFSAVGNVVANINNNQNNNNNNNNNIDLNVVSTSNTQTSVNTNNANTISIMLPPPIPVLAGGRKLEAQERLKRLAASERRRQMNRNKRSTMMQAKTSGVDIKSLVASTWYDIMKLMFEKKVRLGHSLQYRLCLGKRLCKMSLNENKEEASNPDLTIWEKFLYKITSYALLYVQLDDRSMAFLQFLETISEIGGDQISEKDCDEWFWKCEDDNI